MCVAAPSSVRHVLGLHVVRAVHRRIILLLSCGLALDELRYSHHRRHAA